MEETKEIIHVSYISALQNKEDAKAEEEHYSILYAYGVWCAFGVVQLQMCAPYILYWHDFFPDKHPFREGLEIYELNGLLKKKAIRKLFKSNPLSTKEFEEMVEPTEAPTNPFQRYAEERALDEFLTFLRQLEGRFTCICIKSH